MSLVSPCKIEFVPDGGSAIVLANIGDELTHLPRFEAGQDLFERDGVAMETAIFKPRGGARVSITFGTVGAKTTQAQAQAEFLAPEIIGGVNLLLVDGALVFTSLRKMVTYEPAAFAAIKPALLMAGYSSCSRDFQIRTVLPTIQAI